MSLRQTDVMSDRKEGLGTYLHFSAAMDYRYQRITISMKIKQLDREEASEIATTNVVEGMLCIKVWCTRSGAFWEHRLQFGVVP